ncbi:MAG: M24 family metallopeptidase [Thermodesulfobacteriota bacterium]
MAIPAGEMESRWARVQEAMARAKLGGLLVFSNQLNSDLVHYVSNYTVLGEKAFCFLPLKGEPVLLISEAWDLERAVRESHLKDVRVIGKNWPQEIASVSRLSEGRLGVAGRENLGRFGIESLEKPMGQESVSATRFLEELATIKSPYELTLIRETAKMADAGFKKALEVAREGLPDFVLGAEMDYVMREMGATDNFQMLAVGKDNTGMLLPWGKKIERGDLLLFEITPANGSVTYTVQLCRTAIFGEPPSRLLRDKFAVLIEALEESLAVIRPGARISEVARIQNEIIGRAGYPEYCRPPYMRGRGHGFGLGRIDVEEDSTTEFAEGMSLVVHPNQFIPETGYLALGEHIVVTAKGIERLTQTESKIYECGGGGR